MTNENVTMKLEQMGENVSGTGRWEDDKKNQQVPTQQEEEKEKTSTEWERDKKPAGSNG